MNRLARILLCCALLSALLGTHATTFPVRTLDELIGSAELAFHGTVASTETSLRDGNPWTTVTFDITELLLFPADADEPGTQLSLDFLGGAAAGSQLTVALMPQFDAGDEVLLFAYAADHYSPIVGFNQALWRLTPAGEWISDAGMPLGLTEDGNLTDEAAGPAAEVLDELAARLEGR